jgi:polyketide biosynthesis acyl carrier protein
MTSDQMVDLGANSVERAEILTLTMEALFLQIPRIELFRAKSIGELVYVLYEKIQSA